MKEKETENKNNTAKRDDGKRKAVAKRSVKQVGGTVVIDKKDSEKVLRMRMKASSGTEIRHSDKNERGSFAASEKTSQRLVSAKKVRSGKSEPISEMTSKRNEGVPASSDGASKVRDKNSNTRIKSGIGTRKKKNIAKEPVRILFFGGVGEIGKNMTAIEYGNDIIVIDAGDTFPDEEMPGVDLVVPDVSYLESHKDNVRAILLTHGHEDHIGGIAYLLKKLNPYTPVYGTKLTLALVDNKVREHKLQDLEFRTVSPGETVEAGAFTVEFVNVNHSIAGAVALAIRTPYGIIYHSGDFKIDMTPVAGEPIDLNRISELGKEGVLLYMGESTNIERSGYTMSETVVGTTLDRLFAEHSSRRLVIATFASNVHRLQQIIDLSVKHGRHVVLSGRSMLNVVEAATKIDELHIPDGLLVEPDRLKNFEDKEIVVVSTGSQGEPMSALTRMASGEFNKINIGSNDTIIISASPIPGNEKMIYRVINNLYSKGAEVVYHSLENIHVSGHACQEEHKILHTLLNPKFFIPVHGEYRHLKLHGDLAHELGMPYSNIFIPSIGNCFELTDTLLKQTDNFPAGSIIIDGTGSEDFGSSEVIRDRKRIASEGMLVIVANVSGGVLVGEPRIETIGVLFGEERDYAKEVRNVVMTAINQYDLADGDTDGLACAIEKMLHGYLYKKTRQSPLILPIVMEI